MFFSSFLLHASKFVTVLHQYTLVWFDLIWMADVCVIKYVHLISFADVHYIKYGHFWLVHFILNWQFYIKNFSIFTVNCWFSLYELWSTLLLIVDINCIKCVSCTEYVCLNWKALFFYQIYLRRDKLLRNQIYNLSFNLQM